MPTNEDLAYCAGLFDGEGCVNFTTSGYTKTVVLRVMVRNTNRDIVLYLQSTFGGRVETKNRYPGKPHWKASYCWRLDGAQAVEFLSAIGPWVRIKAEQLLIAEAWDAVRSKARGQKRTPEYDEMIELLVSQLKWLNRKGVREGNDLEPIEQCLATLPVPVDQILQEVGYATH